MPPIHWQPLRMLPTLTAMAEEALADSTTNSPTSAPPRSARTAVTMQRLLTPSGCTRSKGSFSQSMPSSVAAGRTQPVHRASSRRSATSPVSSRRLPPSTSSFVQSSTCCPSRQPTRPISQRRRVTSPQMRRWRWPGGYCVVILRRAVR